MSTSPDPTKRTDVSVIQRIRSVIEERGLKRFVKFAIVGASGVLVNMAIFALAYSVLLTHMDAGARVTWAGVMAIGISIVTNFLLNDAWTWGDREKGGAFHFLWRLTKYATVASIAGGVQLVVLKVLVHLGLNAHVANLAGICAGIGINYVANNWWTFRAGAETAPDVDPTPSSVEHIA